MKKSILFLTISAALLTTSCSDFLDVQPEGDATINTYFTNDQQAIDAVDGLYERFHQEALYGRELFWEQGAACDVVWGRTRSYNDLALFKNDAYSSTPLNGIFETLYRVMARSNWVVSSLLQKEKKTPLTAVETRSLGEAYFTRAWSHFLIAYRYGLPEQGVPFVRYEDFEGKYDYSIPPQRTSVQENYELIIEDLNKAIERLPRFEEYDENNRGRAHDAAAIAMKVKVYAYWATWEPQKWNDVITLVNSLENDYHRDLAETFAKVFSSEFADFYNEEYLWAIPGNGGSDGGGSEFPGVVLENKGWGKYNGWGQNKPSLDIYEEMLKDGKGNDRLTRSILAYNEDFDFFGEKRKFFSSSDIEAGFMINKYMEPFGHKDPKENGYINSNGNWPTVRINFPIIRFAEMLLFRAEAYLMTDQPDKAWSDLNRVHKRACGKELPKPATMENLYHERRCELAFEFTDHLFDLKRWHRSSNAEIKKLAQKELNALPRVRVYEDRENPESKYTVETYAEFKNTTKATYEDYRMVFPYPYQQVINSNGKLKQNPGYK
ncbi:RagB/SusD domain protein [gut metagenome]|uniref:RagB/SusD domain protein n=1 Tax=gut metagenome TaxID=749906 RepID=J9FRD6_9ZZZZ